jgi:hypothetical protein
MKKNRIPRKLKKEIKKGLILEADFSYISPLNIGKINTEGLSYIDRSGALINLRIRF